VSIIESLKKLVDPVAARQTQAEWKSTREQPLKERTGAPPVFECRVCAYVGAEPQFCPQCLAGTMRPSRKQLPVAEALDTTPSVTPSVDGDHGADAAGGVTPLVEPPIDGTLDLHTFRPGEVRELLPEYLESCGARGLRELRIVHGKGTGNLRRTVAGLLARSPLVESCRPADESAGGWGATLVTLRGRTT
jgi:hypothetical protein